MAQRKQEIRDYVERRHKETWQVLQSLTPEELELQVYGHGGGPGWTARELIAHLADAEPGLLSQARRVAAGEPPLPPDFDIDRWNRSAVRRRKDESFAAHLRLIASAHEEALQFLDEVDESALDLEGVRPGQERLTVEGYFRRMVDHRAEHIEDLQRARRRASGGE